MKVNKELYEINTREQLLNIIYAGAFFGSGGGGSIAGGYRLMKDILSFEKSIKIIPPEQINKGEKGAVVALMGSPLALESATDLSSPSISFKALEKGDQKKYSFCLPVELGAVNSLVPLNVALRNDISVINGDGAGRAVPQLGNTTFAANNIPVTPSALANTPSEQNPLIQTIVDINTELCPNSNASEELEVVARHIVEAENFGNIGGLATFPMNDDQLKSAVIPYTFSFLISAGAVISHSLDQHIDPLPKLVDWIEKNFSKFVKCFSGKVTLVTKPKTINKLNVTAATEGGFDVGVIEVTNQKGDVLKINYMNENLFATLKQEGNPEIPWAMAPDLICMITPEGPLTNVEIKEGISINIVGIPCFSSMRNPVIVKNFLKILLNLKVYNGPYIPIEKLPFTKVEKETYS